MERHCLLLELVTLQVGTINEEAHRRVSIPRAFREDELMKQITILSRQAARAGSLRSIPGYPSEGQSPLLGCLRELIIRRERTNRQISPKRN